MRHLLSAPLLALAACSQPVETLEPWPFTVPEVTLSCERLDVPGARSPRRVFVTTADGRRYGANGSAMAVAPRTDPIQSHYDTQPVILRGLELCDRSEGPITLRRRPGPAPAPPQVPSVEVDRSDPLLGTSFTIVGEPAGTRPPRLSFSCGGRTGKNILFDFGADPRLPPGLRGAFATFSFRAGQPTRVEMSWGGERYWRPRDDDADDALISRFLSSGELSVTPPPENLPPTPIAWRAATLGPHLAEARRLCR